jgi:hypothetical protein
LLREIAGQVRLGVLLEKSMGAFFSRILPLLSGLVHRFPQSNAFSCQREVEGGEGERDRRSTTQERSGPPAKTTPTDIDRPRSSAKRVEWVLANVYCTCKVRNNTCTGHFYTLASCNPNGCGQPNAMREQVRKLIDEGKSDRQIFDVLKTKEGELLTRPHLLP